MNSDQLSYGFTITSTSLCNTAYQPTVELLIKGRNKKAADFLLLHLSVIAFHLA